MAASKNSKGMRGWFRRCVASVSKNANVIDPQAVCGAALRKKRAEGYMPEREQRAKRKRSSKGKR